jgi:hypothetical protein
MVDPLSWFSDQGPVAAVDPGDLRSVWEMQRDFQRNAPNHAPNQTGSIDISLYQRACSPGAEVGAVWYRVSMLQLLAGPIGLLTPWLHDGELPDAVFKLAATFPMNKLSVGEVNQGLPFDVQGFIKQLEQQTSR